MSNDKSTETPIEESVYDRGGPEPSVALVSPGNSIIEDENGLLNELQKRFNKHDLKIIATDGSITAPNKSVNITLFLQTVEGKMPPKPKIIEVLANMGANTGLSTEDYTLFEVNLITDSGDLHCLALTFQGDEKMQMARDKMPALAQLETEMKKMINQANKLVRVVVQGLGLFSSKKSSPSSGSNSPTNDNDRTHRGPGR